MFRVVVDQLALQNLQFTAHELRQSAVQYLFANPKTVSYQVSMYTSSFKVNFLNINNVKKLVTYWNILRLS